MLLTLNAPEHHRDSQAVFLVPTVPGPAAGQPRPRGGGAGAYHAFLSTDSQWAIVEASMGLASYYHKKNYARYIGRTVPSGVTLREYGVKMSNLADELSERARLNARSHPRFTPIFVERPGKEPYTRHLAVLSKVELPFWKDGQVAITCCGEALLTFHWANGVSYEKPDGTPFLTDCPVCLVRQYPTEG